MASASAPLNAGSGKDGGQSQSGNYILGSHWLKLYSRPGCERLGPGTPEAGRSRYAQNSPPCPSSGTRYPLCRSCGRILGYPLGFSHVRLRSTPPHSETPTASANRRVPSHAHVAVVCLTTPRSCRSSILPPYPRLRRTPEFTTWRLVRADAGALIRVVSTATLG